MYKISEQTRLALIQAAGELFGELGPDAVTTRQIAARAGTVQNAISYHFHGIAGLKEAVWNYVLAAWDLTPFRDFLAANPVDSKTPAEKAAMVRTCIHLLFQIICRPDRPLWISKFLVRCSLTAEGSEYVGRMISGFVAPKLIDLFREITGSADRAAGQCWCFRILAAPVVFTANLSVFTRFQSRGQANFPLYAELEEMTIREALFSLGLTTLPVKEANHE